MCAIYYSLSYYLFKEPVLNINEGEIIYDFCWFPLMSSQDSTTCWLVYMI